MAKKKTTKRTASQIKKAKRLQHFNNSARLAKRSKRQLPGWEHEKTSGRNYDSLGILVDANDATSKVRARGILQPVNPENVNEEYEDLVVIPAKVKTEEVKGTLTDYLDRVKNLPKLAPYVAKSMNPQEQYILQDLIRKHGENYEKMARDIKINIYQHTPRYLEKRIALMTRLFQEAEAAELEALAAAEAEKEAEDADDLDEDLAIEMEAEAEMLEQIKNDPEFLKLIGGEDAMRDMTTKKVIGESKNADKAASQPKTLDDLQKTVLKQLQLHAVHAQRKIEDAIKTAIEEERRGPVEIRASGDRVAITGEKLVEKRVAANRGANTWKSGGDLRVKYAGGRIYRYVAPKLLRILPATDAQRRKFFRKDSEIEAAESLRR